MSSVAGREASKEVVESVLGEFTLRLIGLRGLEKSTVVVWSREQKKMVQL